MTRRARHWLLLAFLAGPPVFAQPDEPKLKYEEPKLLTATIYAKGSKREKVLFHFKRTATRAGSNLEVLRDFTYPDGKLAARERATYDTNGLVSFQLEEPQAGTAGRVTFERSAPGADTGSIHFTWRPGPPPARAKIAGETLRPNVLTGDSVGPFLADHWGELVKGDRVKCRYLVVPRLETIGFTFVKDSEPKGAQNVIVVRMEPTSRIIGLAVNPLFFTIQKDPPHHVLEYVGRTTPRLPADGKWSDVDAVTVFDWK